MTKQRDELLKHSSVMFVGMMGVNICNMLFQSFMGRKLSSDEFGILNALLGVLNIFIIPLGVVSAGLSRYTSLLVQQDRQGDIRRLVFKWTILLGSAGLFFSLICFVCPQRIADFFHLDRVAPIIITGVILLGVFCRPVVDGALHGLQCFVRYSVFHSLSAFVRVFSGTLLVIFISASAGWGLLGHGIGSYAALLIGGIFLVRELSSHAATTKPLPSLRGYLLSTFLVMLGYAVLMTGDVVFVKHLYPDAAGEFAYASILGHMVVFIPQAFVLAMFPKVVSESGTNSEHWKMLLNTLRLTLVFTVMGAIGISLMPKLAFLILFGISNPDPQSVAWCVSIGWTMIPIALVNVVVRYYLAQNRFVALLSVPFAALLFSGMVFLQKGSVWSVIGSLAIVGVFLMFALGIVCLKDRPRINVL